MRRSVSTAAGLYPGAPATRQSQRVGAVVRQTGRRLLEAGPDGRAALLPLARRGFQLASLGTIAPRGVTITQVPGTGEWVRARGVGESRPVLYFHGGGYFFGSPRQHRGLSWRLSAATRRPVLMVRYRLVPEHTAMHALTDALAAYGGLLAQGHEPEHITVGGDSAGGHLALSLVHELKRRGQPLPGAIVGISPWVDLRCTADSHRLNEASDTLLPARRLAWLGRYLAATAPADLRVHAPAEGDYTGFPPLLLVSSSTEILRDDSRHLAKRAAAAGVDVEHHEWAGQTHVFPVFSDFVPEGKAAIRHIAAFLRGR
ncbi:alpha/beta hydrolase [Streptomyces polyrhachis]|uniref:Alpha/beta hydrolase n=1 Tax=Streptomyces polyrhachis TaxID=1282885 RepID=A0ABW2GF56_9ACTN